MLIPTLVFDNFFNYPDKIVEFANSLDYDETANESWDDGAAAKGLYPGVRSKNLLEIDSHFFNYVNFKLLASLYPSPQLQVSYNATTMFQKISSLYTQKGWVHQDVGHDLTFIVYLSKHKECGTSIFEPKTHSMHKIHSDKKNKNYKNKQFNDDHYLNENNSKFEETINIKSRFNRMIALDSQHFHAAQKFIESNIEEDRLTLISFVSNIKGNMKFNAVENRRI